MRDGLVFVWVRILNAADSEKAEPVYYNIINCPSGNICGSGRIILPVPQKRENMELTNVFAEMLQEEGSEIYFRPAED